jgi:hypothetical protein
MHPTSVLVISGISFLRDPLRVRWLFRRFRRQTHRLLPAPASTFAANPHHAAQLHSTSSLLKILRHRVGSEPPPRSVEDEKSDDDSFNFILGSPTMFLLDVVHILFKPTLGASMRL